jgi:hypothetical protein
MKVVLRNPRGKRLKTAKTVVREDIEVVPELQKQLIFKNGTYTVGEGFAGIGEVVVNVSGGGTEEVKEWDGTGVIIAPIEPVAPNTFKINGTSYQMENRMTWYEWSQRVDLNTDNFRCANTSSYVYEAESNNVVTDTNSIEVLGGQEITEGAEYLIKKGV